MQKKSIKVQELPILSKLTDENFCTDKEAFNLYHNFYERNTGPLIIGKQENQLISRLEIKFGQRMKGQT